MKFNSFNKIVFFISSFFFCFVFIVPLSGAEQSTNDFTKQIFSAQDLTFLKASLQEKGTEPVVPEVSDAGHKTSSFDVKIPLNEQLNAMFSLEKPYIADMTGRDNRQFYNAVVGFQIILQ